MVEMARIELASESTSNGVSPSAADVCLLIREPFTCKQISDYPVCTTADPGKSAEVACKTTSASHLQAEVSWLAGRTMLQMRNYCLYF